MLCEIMPPGFLFVLFSCQPSVRRYVASNRRRSASTVSFRTLTTSAYSKWERSVIVSPDRTHGHMLARQDSPGRRIDPSQRPLHLYNTQHSQQTNIHAVCAIRTRSPNKRAATDYALDRAASGIG